MNDPIPSHQEMFNRAVRGLAGQGWKPAYVLDKSFGLGVITCQYLTDDGRRCAWGHVDHDTLLGTREGTIEDLAAAGAGLAARLTGDDLAFGRRLQSAHDDPFIVTVPDNEPLALFNSMREFGRREQLTWPDDVPEVAP